MEWNRIDCNIYSITKYYCIYLSTVHGHAHGIGVHSLIIDKYPTFTEIFLLRTEC